MSHRRLIIDKLLNFSRREIATTQIILDKRYYVFIVDHQRADILIESLSVGMTGFKSQKLSASEYATRRDETTKEQLRHLRQSKEFRRWEQQGKRHGLIMNAKVLTFLILVRSQVPGCRCTCSLVAVVL